jgi:hypothetical protein
MRRERIISYCSINMAIREEIKKQYNTNTIKFGFNVQDCNELTYTYSKQNDNEIIPPYLNSVLKLFTGPFNYYERGQGGDPRQCHQIPRVAGGL